MEPSVQARLEDEAARTTRQMALALEIQAADTRLPLMTALTIAGDRLSKEVADRMLADGDKPWPMCAVFVGSYARMEWIVEKVEAGLIDEAEVYPRLPDEWRSSDPDDTDYRFLHLWQRARDWRRIYLRDEKALPRQGILWVYRGQDEGAKLGIAWTLDETVARKFATGAATRQFDRGGVVYKARVRRKDVLGYMTGRHESEVVLDPRLLMIDE